MSLRYVQIQYLGSALNLPKLERDVTLIVTRDGKRFVPERTQIEPLPERCEDCWYYVPEEWWEEPTEVGYPPMPMCEPPTCTGWEVVDSKGEHYVHNVPPDGHCHKWEPRYQVKRLSWECEF